MDEETLDGKEGKVASIREPIELLGREGGGGGKRAGRRTASGMEPAVDLARDSLVRCRGDLCTGVGGVPPGDSEKESSDLMGVWKDGLDGAEKEEKSEKSSKLDEETGGKG